MSAGLAVIRKLMSSQAAVEELEYLSRLLADQRVALLCFERDHHHCHRQAVAAPLTARRPGLPLVLLQ